jgi:hypothetical protein
MKFALQRNASASIMRFRKSKQGACHIDRSSLDDGNPSQVLLNPFSCPHHTAFSLPLEPRRVKAKINDRFDAPHHDRAGENHEKVRLG